MSDFRYWFLFCMILALLLGQITSEIRYGRSFDKLNYYLLEHEKRANHAN